MRKAWTPDELDLLRQRYPHELTRELAKILGRSESSVYAVVRRLGLKKSAAFLRSDLSGRVQRGQQDPRMRASQFRPGMTPWNKGKSFQAGGRSIQTRFKKGQMVGAARHNYVPIGSTRVVNGNLEKKVTDDPALYPAKRWRPVHRMVWEAANGMVPKGCVVVFRPGKHTQRECDITLDRLECITRAELVQRNSIHRYPRPLRDVMRLKAQITRQLNQRGCHEKQD